MDRLLVYTVQGEALYTNPASPGLVGLLSDLDESAHFALSHDGGPFTPLRSGTGIVFATADFDSGVPGGVTRTLVDPWLLRADEGFVLLGVRRPEGDPARSDGGDLIAFRSRDLVRWSDETALPVASAANESVRHPRGEWGIEQGMFYLEWEIVDASGTVLRTEAGTSRALLEVADVRPATDAPDAESARTVPGNVLDLTAEESRRLRDLLGPIAHTATTPPAVTVSRGASLTESDLPSRVTCTYSDGSTHDKPVEWDVAALAGIETSEPGSYEITGRITQPHYPFPFLPDPMSDPCLCDVEGRLFLTATDPHGIAIREARTVAGLREAEPLEVVAVADGSEGPDGANVWAQEMHLVAGVPYVFTTIGRSGWTSVQCVVVACHGDPADPAAWGQPQRVVRADGSELSPHGICLDMTYFCVGGVHYVCWSAREVIDPDPAHTVVDSADLYLATIDPCEPWRLTSEPALILRPTHGWERCEAPVVEGPYLLRHGQDLWMSVACASTALPDLYCVGLLHSRVGENLLDPAAWDWQRFPALAKESVPGEYGPGHNSFLRDRESGDDLLVYHAVPHDADGRALGRHMAVRRVHWAVDGRPYLEMTEARDLDPTLADVTARVTVR